ncbi:hypothetical protein N9M16_03935 [Candidatus Dependentiae bacterium]|nr:hypothetical protein [Candidatus Dependentiae bacterium]
MWSEMTFGGAKGSYHRRSCPLTFTKAVNKPVMVVGAGKRRGSVGVGVGGEAGKGGGVSRGADATMTEPQARSFERPRARSRGSIGAELTKR